MSGAGETPDDLKLTLENLVPPGGGHPTTIGNTTNAQQGSGSPAFASAPKGWEPGYKIQPDGSMEVFSMATTENVQGEGEHAFRAMVEDLGLTIPHGFTVRLAEAKYDPRGWGRTAPFSEWPDADQREAKGQSRWTKTPALTEPVWRYRFLVEPDSKKVHVDDVDRIVGEVLRKRRKRPPTIKAPRRSLNVVYADPQAGKTGSGGGTAELAERLADCFLQLEDHLRDLKAVGRQPTEAAWLDAGDSCEGFQNTRQQAQTNDMTLTQQIRFHRRITLHGLDWLAARFPDVKAATCGSNHPRNRDGKDPLAGPQDDWGIEVLAQVQDAYSRNPAAYGHVSFAYPPPFRDTLSLDLGGLLVGMAHGHQWRPDQVVKWWQGQTFGEQPVAHARVLVSGHYHHLAMKEMGNGRLWIQAPTIDAGSDWFTGLAGEVSEPGMLVFSTTEHGWEDLRILRPRVGLTPAGLPGMAA